MPMPHAHAPVHMPQCPCPNAQAPVHLPQVLIGLTPFVDNFMHMGGMVAGLVIGGMLFSKQHPDLHGVLRYKSRW